MFDNTQAEPETEETTFIDELCAYYGVEKVKGWMTEINDAKPRSNSDPRIVFSTVHSFKGKEARTVVLTDNDERFSTANVQSANLLFVAVTRPRCHLILPKRVYKLIQPCAHPLLP